MKQRKKKKEAKKKKKKEKKKEKEGKRTNERIIAETKENKDAREKGGKSSIKKSRCVSKYE